MKAHTAIFAIFPPAIALAIAGYFLFSSDSSETSENTEPPEQVAGQSNGASASTPDAETSADAASGAAIQEKQGSTQQPPPDAKTRQQPPSAIAVPAVESETKEPPSDYYYKILTCNAESLSSNDLWRKCAMQPDCLVTLVKIVDQLSNGNLPLAVTDFDFLPVPSSFAAVQNADGDYVASPETMNRFTTVIEAICSVSSPNTKDLLNYLEPELNRIVHEKLGYPQETTFRGMLKEALNHVLATPLLAEPPPLVRLTSRIYRYKDEELEKLSQAQKFILRLGPKNQKTLFEYLIKILHNV